MATIVHVPFEKLVLTPNPVSEQDYQPILESISRFVLQYPLLVVKADDGYYHIVDGRTRYKALKHLSWKEVPCIVVENPEIVSVIPKVKSHFITTLKCHIPFLPCYPAGMI